MIRIGIAGFGKIGQLRAEILLERDDVEIVGIYDVVKPENLNTDITFYKSYDELLKSGIDAVFICAYNTVLAEYTAKALDYGLHVFCEKPPAMKIEELDVVFDSLKNIREEVFLLIKEYTCLI